MDRGGDDGAGQRAETTADARQGTPAERHGTAWFGRRRFVGAVATAGAGLLAGCGTLLDGDDGQTRELDIAGFRGSGPLVEQRDRPGGTSIAELPDLEGSLTVFVSFGEGGRYLELLDRIAALYDGFEYEATQDSSGGLANRIRQEAAADASRADVFIAVDAGALGTVADAGVTRELPDPVRDAVPERLRTDTWVGFAGRARAVPYYTDGLSAGDVPDAVADFPDVAAFGGAFGWAPTYSAFQSFVTAMRLRRGEDETRSWLQSMQDLDPTAYNSEFNVANGVADGELAAGFANHYYALRVRNARPNAPIDLAFTSGDAGALINVSGATVVDDTDTPEPADNLLRHLVSAEAQEFFATHAFEYPTIPGVDPVGGLPPIDELNPPDVDLAALSDRTATIDLLRDTDVLS